MTKSTTLSTQASKSRPAILALADGTVFRGVGIGHEGETTGEVVFNTSMYGYQEILTDPSYAFQMLTFTYTHIGNVGVNEEDVESDKVHVSGMIVREASEHFSNFRATSSLGSYLEKNKVVGISGIDTRKLVLHLRTHGAQMGIIAAGENLKEKDLIEKAKVIPSMEGLDLVKSVASKKPYEWRQGAWVAGVGMKSKTDAELKNAPHLIAIDFGIKYNILRLMVDQGFRVTVVPPTMSATEIMALKPDAFFLSNGPGDPAAVTYGVETVKELLGKKPAFGICLGHQILGLALGAPTYKLKFGHRGGNHPVRDERTGKVEITVQNHGFATDATKVPKGLRISHINLNDKTVEGFDVPELNAFSIQYHPESSPGPHDAQYLFRRFRKLVEDNAR